MKPPPSDRLDCLVCTSPADAVHFGAASCRACAAFFRRKVATNREVRKKCDGRCRLEGVLLRRLCVGCRFEKCGKVGMRRSAVVSGTSSEDVPHLNAQKSVLKELEMAYSRLQSARKATFQTEGKTSPKLCDYQQLNDLLFVDFRLIFANIIQFFRNESPIEEDQERHLLTQFILTFVMLDGAFRSMNADHYILPNGDYVDPSNLEVYYANPDDESDEKARYARYIFEPYWKQNDKNLRHHFEELHIDFCEFLILCALVYWDFGLGADRTEECVEVCRNMRARVLEELVDYEKSKQGVEDHCLRVGEIVIALQAIQKAMDLMYESRNVSIVYNLYERHCAFFEIIST